MLTFLTWVVYALAIGFLLTGLVAALMPLAYTVRHMKFGDTLGEWLCRVFVYAGVLIWVCVITLGIGTLIWNLNQ